MSHFAALVITDEQPTDELLAKTLQPWHEYECTGVDDEYVIDVDITEDVLESWGHEVSAVRLADGTVKCRFDSCFYHKTEDGSDFQLPDGAEEIRIPQSELSVHTGESLHKHAREYHGAEERHGRFFRHTNPNKKWDWWVVGGRFSGMLAIQGTGKRVDVANIASLDLGAMKRDRMEDRRSHVNDCMTQSGLCESDLEQGIKERAKLMGEWRKLDEPRPRGNHFQDWLSSRGAHNAAKASKCWDLPEIGELSINEWISAAPPLGAFAVVKNGQWYQRGRMGWWAIVADEDDEWDSKLEELFESLKPEQWVAVVDCHI